MDAFMTVGMAGVRPVKGGGELDFSMTERERRILRRAGVTVRYPRGQIIFAAGEQADRVYLIEAGHVRVYRLDPRGRETAVDALRKPGELLGVAETLYGGRRPCFARAVTGVTLVVLSVERFLDILGAEDRLALKVASLFAARMREAEEQAYRLMSRPVPGRLAAMLLKFGEAHGIKTEKGVRIGIPLTCGEIASMIGSTRQTVTALLNAFRDEGLIEAGGREIIIRDPAKLAERAARETWSG